MHETHTVDNQSTPFERINLLACDAALLEAVQRAAPAAVETLLALGARLAEPEVLALGALANANPPRLLAYDRFGRRIDEIEFHPAWHQLMTLMMEAGLHAPSTGPGAEAARACAFMLFAQVENGAQCPVTMTYASAAALRFAPALAAQWLPKIQARRYDARSLPLAQKRGALLGMGMTEKQGGSDVRSNTAFAEKVVHSPFAGRGGPAYDDNELYKISGHKWFFSAPQSDAHLILAQTDPASSAGLSCFLVPRFLPDERRNAIRVMRLKDKLGNRSNASAEVEFDGAYGWRVGAVGRGVATILEMGNRTRLDCVLGSAGMMRAALTHALHHARLRRAFGRPLVGHALMQNVLADLALETEAAAVFALRLAQCYDHPDDRHETALARVLTPAGKYWICKRGPAVGAEAMEVLGGNGYVEEAPLARLYREFPVNSIWEGSGNIMCLDLLRAWQRSPDAATALQTEFAQARAQAAGLPDATLGLFDAATRGLLDELDGLAAAAMDAAAVDAREYGARRLAERLVVAVQAGLLLRHAPVPVAHAFIVSRLGGGVGGAFGRLPAGVDCTAILQRALPI